MVSLTNNESIISGTKMAVKKLRNTSRILCFLTIGREMIFSNALKISPLVLSFCSNVYDINGNFIKTWDCIGDIERELSVNKSNICQCCKGKYKQTGGYIWRYNND